MLIEGVRAYLSSKEHHLHNIRITTSQLVTMVYMVNFAESLCLSLTRGERLCAVGAFTAPGRITLTIAIRPWISFTLHILHRLVIAGLSI
jgi:hypothetical protein